jgi:hypothetical protein
LTSPPIAAIGVEPAIDQAAAFFKPRGEITAHQAKPVAIDRHLVGTVDRRDGILEVHDRGQRRFQLHIGDTRRVVASDRMLAIDVHLDVQPVMLEQQCGRRRFRAEVTLELFRAGKHGLGAVTQCYAQRAARDDVADRFKVVALGKRHGLVQHRAHALYDSAAPGCDVTLAARQCAGFLDGIRAIQGVVEAAPASVGGIERVTRVVERYDQLRTCEQRDLRIDIARADLKILPFGHQVTDAAQVSFVACGVERLPAPGTMPGIDLELQLVAPFEQGLVDRHELIQQRGESIPEASGVESEVRGNFLFDQLRQRGRNP